MTYCPHCRSSAAYPIPFAGDLEDYYCPGCDHSFTGSSRVIGRPRWVR